MDEHPVTIVSDMVNTDDTTRCRILESGTCDSADAKCDSLVDGHIPLVLGIKNTISKSTTRADSE